MSVARSTSLSSCGERSSTVFQVRVCALEESAANVAFILPIASPSVITTVNKAGLTQKVIKKKFVRVLMIPAPFEQKSFNVTPQYQDCPRQFFIKDSIFSGKGGNGHVSSREKNLPRTQVLPGTEAVG